MSDICVGFLSVRARLLSRAFDMWDWLTGSRRFFGSDEVLGSIVISGTRPSL